MKLLPTQADLARSRLEISREGDEVRVRVPAVDAPLARHVAWLAPLFYLGYLATGGAFLTDGNVDTLMLTVQLVVLAALVFSAVQVRLLFKGASQNAILSDGMVRYFRQNMTRHSALDIKAAEISSVAARESSAAAGQTAAPTRYTVVVGRNGNETELFSGLNQGDADQLAALIGQFVADHRAGQTAPEEELQGGVQPR
ncbi:hypothetical protein [Stappia indica]|uniref:hypothetical protein n=1 Tax=Stappia indica TaxID=538381 RepID=UPI001D192082|nr:hypothetical protein [Stappia indica]MCC4244965.1 hypothetical protein [Stappia indica]